MKYCPVCENDYPDDVTVCPLDGGIVRRPGERADPFVGRVIRGRYRVERRLGEGGMGTVYLAEQLSIGRKVALKVLRGDFAHDDAFVTRFRQEAKLVAVLNNTHNPHVTLVHDFDQSEDGSLFIVMECLEGRGLNEVIRSEGALPLPRAVRLAAQIAQGLEAAHRAGVIHRDIKPHNIMVLTATDSIKLMDFGIARLRDSGDTHLTRAGTMMGTPDYMAPEQIEGHAITDKTDIYAFGIVFYEMLTGTVPFRASAPGAVLTKQLNEAPTPPSRLRPDIPPDVETLILRALEKKPEDRPGDMGEIARPLTQLSRRLTDAADGPGAFEARPVTTSGGRPSATVAVTPAPSSTATWAPAPGALTVPPSPAPSPGAGDTWAVRPPSNATVVVADAAGSATPPPPRGRTTSRQPLLVAGAGAVVVVLGLVGLWAYLNSSSRTPPPLPQTPVVASPTTEGTGAVAPVAPPAATPPPAVVTSAPDASATSRPPAATERPVVPPATKPAQERPRPVESVERPPAPSGTTKRPPVVAARPRETVDSPSPGIVTRPAPTAPSSDSLRALVEDRLRGRGLLRGSTADPDSGITVEVNAERVVTLRGIVRDTEQRDEAVRLARVTGVVEVRPRINIAGSWK